MSEGGHRLIRPTASTMEKSVNKSSSSKLKHRITRMLLGTSCTTTIATTTTTKLPGACPQHLDFDLDRHFHLRRKLDCPWPLPGNDRNRPRSCAAPAVHFSISCGARQAVDASEPLLPLLRKEEEKEMNKNRSKIDLERTMSSSRRCLEAKKSLLDAYDFTSSSCDDRSLDLFSSSEEKEDENETRNLLSSKSFSSDSSDSSDFYRKTRKKENNNNCTRSSSMKRTPRSPRRQAKHLEGVRPLISVKEEKAKTNAGGFAVVKRSTDPYRDFRSSMVEMIVERGMSSARELEGLLDDYLALNLPRHNEVILEAFADVCEAMFGRKLPPAQN